MTIEIHKPLENIKIAGENVKAVGIPEWRLKNEPSLVTVDIKYQYKGKSLVQGQRQFPHKYTIAKSEVLKSEKREQKTRQGIQVFYVVPISKMTEIEQAEVFKSEPPIIVKTTPQSKIPTKPCWACGCTKFWRAPWQSFICIRCHPNPNPGILEEIIDVAEKIKEKI